MTAAKTNGQKVYEKTVARIEKFLASQAGMQKLGQSQKRANETAAGINEASRVEREKLHEPFTV